MKKTFTYLLLLSLPCFSSCDLVWNESQDYTSIRHNLLWERLADCEGEIGKEKGDASIEAAVFSPNDRYVASVSHQGSDIIVWDSESGESHWEGSMNYPLKSVRFNPRQSQILIGGESNFVKILDVNTGKLIHTLNAGDDVEYITFSNNKKYLAVGNSAGMIIIWETSNYKKIKELVHDKETVKHDVNTLCFTENDKYLISGGYNSKIICWNVKDDFSETWIIDQQFGSVKSVRVSPNGKYVASSSSERSKDHSKGNSLCIWDIKSGKNILTMHYAFGMEAIEFSPNGQFLLAGGTEGKNLRGSFAGFGNIYVYKINTDETKPFLELTNKIKTFRSEYLHFNSTGSRLLSAHEDGSIKMWNVEYLN